MGLIALSMEDTKELMLERIELGAGDGLGSGGVASGCLRGDTSAESGGGAAALMLRRRGDDIGFMALSREATREVMPDMNPPPPPSDEPPLSFFFNKASAFACCFSAAAASLAT